MNAKHNVMTINRIDRVENVQRIGKMNDYHKEKLLEKIEEDSARAYKIK